MLAIGKRNRENPMARKPKKRSLKCKLDKVVSQIVRTRGKCERCGVVNQLQCCHIFSRTYMSVRFFLTNLLCLCAGCHFWAHKNPILFAEFVKKYFGKYKYTQLKLKARMIKKWSISELEVLLETLEERLVNYCLVKKEG